MAKKPEAADPDHFMVRLSLPRTMRSELREAAGHYDLPMAEFARQAVMEKIERYRAERAKERK